MRVLVPTGVQMGLLRFVQASTTMTRSLFPLMLKPNCPALTPKLVSLLVGILGFHRTAARPPNVEVQPVVPGK